MTLLLLLLEKDQQGHPPKNTGSYGSSEALAALSTNRTTPPSSHIAQHLYSGSTLVAWKISYSPTTREGSKSSRGKRLEEPPPAWLGKVLQHFSPQFDQTPCETAPRRGWGEEQPMGSARTFHHQQTPQKPAAIIAFIRSHFGNNREVSKSRTLKHS